MSIHRNASRSSPTTSKKIPPSGTKTSAKTLSKPTIRHSEPAFVNWRHVLLLSRFYLPKSFDRVARTEVVQFVQLAHFNFRFRSVAYGIRKTFAPLDRLFSRFGLDQRVPRDQLLRLGERPVYQFALSSGVLHAPALRGWLQPRRIEQHSSFREFLVVYRHRLKHLFLVLREFARL